ncbi:MAG TPA: hypothetical protein VKB51_06490 [bacterium]|nr:hypothetical protein [bacterium]
MEVTKPFVGEGAVAAARDRPLPLLLRFVSVFVLANYAALVGAYLLLDNFFDYVEPGLASVSWLVTQGQPLYAGPGAAAQHNFMYGPVLFLVNAAILKLLGPGLFTSKLGAGLFALLSVGFLGLALRKVAGPHTALCGAALLVLIYFAFWPFNTFIARADALILGFVALGLWGALLPGPRAAALVLAVAAGCAVNVKAHAGFYFLPIALLMLEAHGLGWLLAAALGGAAVVLLPFLVSAEISLSGYVAWLEVAARPGLDWSTFLDRVEQTTIFLVLPAVMVVLALDRPLERLRPWKLYLWALGIATAAVMIVASHPGAGKVHLAPLAIPLAYWLALLMRDGFGWRSLAASGQRRVRVRAWVSAGLFTILVLTAIPVNIRMGKLAILEGRHNDAVEDIQSVLRRYPGQHVAMGYGTTDHNYLTWFRPLLVYAGNPYLIDESSMGDLQAAGRDLPPATLQALADCRVDIWLIPKGDPPFMLGSSLGYKHLFSDRFRQAFQAHYERRTSSRYYDLWFCRR